MRPVLIGVALGGIGIGVTLALWNPRSEGPGATDHALISVERGESVATSFATMDVASIETMVHFRRMTRPVVLESASFLELHGPLRLVAARATFLRSEHRESFLGMPGSICGRWPARKWGPLPSYPIEGLNIDEGDEFAVTLFVVAEEPGRWWARGIELEYEDGGVSKTYRDDLSKVVLVRAESIDALPRAPHPCDFTFDLYEPVGG